MSQIYSRSVALRGNPNVIFDNMSTYLSTRKFLPIDTVKGSSIVSDRGMIRPTSKIEKYPHTLVLTFRNVDTTVTMSFFYIMSDFWHYTAGDRKFFDDEIDLFVRGLVADGAILEEQGPSAAPDMAYISELRELAKLKEEGIITADDFENKKRRLLGI